MTNVNFDGKRFRNDYIPRAQSYRRELSEALEARQVDLSSLAGTPAALPLSMADLDAFMADKPEVLARQEALGPEVSGVQELITYGAKGLSAYASHAKALGQEDDAVRRCRQGSTAEEARLMWVVG
jgi:hydroxylamine reductase